MSAFTRIRVEIEGIVQGVGFRPYVFRLAGKHGASGWVRNTPGGVLLEAEGSRANLLSFLCDIEQNPPPLACIGAVKKRWIPPQGDRGFLILPSISGTNQIQIAPDSDVCDDCLAELFEPRNRRYRYPFINCTNCGPRYSITVDIPYDRPNTTMAPFTMCSACREEYDNPEDRRFHAQPNACSECGPRLRLTDSHGKELDGDAIDRAVALLKEGRILAVKGLAGYHLALDSCNNDAVRELRLRKGRYEKPFALMVPTLSDIELHVHCNDVEKRILMGPERPIVILPKRAGSPISPLVAPANGYCGIMLPATPLHHLLLRNNFSSLVMTSGNLTDEPVLFRDEELYATLAGMADFFLTHDRAIHTRSDDSVIRIFQGNPLFLRRSRGYVPRAVCLPRSQKSVLAVGGELKNVVCLTKDDKAFMSQHIGDLKTSAAHGSMEEIVAHLVKTLGVQPIAVAHDLHPDYLSTTFAAKFKDIPKVAVQHHHAHMASCMAENGLEGEVIGVIFDGAGFGLDGNIWGGEFFVGGYHAFQRCGHFRLVPMPGGDAAAREPFRMAIAYLHDYCGDSVFDLSLPCLDMPGIEKTLLVRMLEQGINSPLTTSCGRLFDAVAAILEVRNRNAYEGHAAIELEALAEGGEPGWKYPYAIFKEEGKFTVDFRMMMGALLHDLDAGESRPAMARRFHDSVAAAAADVCMNVRRENGIERVVLSGGVFQNKMLTEELHHLLSAQGFQVFTHRLAPPNDGGLALGQAAVAGRTVFQPACKQ